MAERCDADGSNGSRMMASNLLKMQVEKTVGIRYDNKNRPDFNRLLFLCPTGRKERMMNLKQLMYFKEKNGYTFEQLSELSGVPVGTIQKIFSGETRTPRHKTIQALEMIMKFDEQNEDSGQGSYTLDDYFATPENVRVELIDGVIYDMGMPSTVHQYLITKICHAIYSYIEEKGGHCMVFPASPGVQIDCDDRSMLVPDL